MQNYSLNPELRQSDSSTAYSLNPESRQSDSSSLLGERGVMLGEEQKERGVMLSSHKKR
jgi:hypothetical protein